VDALVRCGARLDNLVLAAAAGDLAAVRTHFDEAGRLKPMPASLAGYETQATALRACGTRL
jgi:hypothetical protein